MRRCGRCLGLHTPAHHGHLLWAPRLAMHSRKWPAAAACGTSSPSRICWRLPSHMPSALPCTPQGPALQPHPGHPGLSDYGSPLDAVSDWWSRKVGSRVSGTVQAPGCESALRSSVSLPPPQDRRNFGLQNSRDHQLPVILLGLGGGVCRPAAAPHPDAKPLLLL